MTRSQRRWLLPTISNKKYKNFGFPYSRVLNSIMVLFVFAGMSFFSIKIMKSPLDFKYDFVTNEKVCKEITEKRSVWSEDGIEENRLEVALALYSAGELAVSCLKKEIDFELELNASSSSAYFSKGLLSLESDIDVIKYFKKTCQLNPFSQACLVATWITQWPNSYEKESAIVGETFNELPTFAKVWSIKRDYSKGNVRRLSMNLKDFLVPQGLENFFTEHLTRLAVFEDGDHFAPVLKLSNLKSKRNRSLTEKYCATKISQSCKKYDEYKICTSLKISRQTDKHLVNMLHACHGESKKVFSSDELKEKFYLQMARNDDFILNDLKLIFMNNKNGFNIRYATLTKFFSSTQDSEYLALLKDEWINEQYKDFFWRLIGENLKEKFVTLSDQQNSFEVFKALAREFDDIMPSRLNTEDGLSRIPASRISIPLIPKAGR